MYVLVLVNIIRISLCFRRLCLWSQKGLWLFDDWSATASGPLFTKKTPSYGYRDPHDKPKTVWRPSQAYNGNPYTDKQRVLMHGHQGWNVRHCLCHHEICMYIWVVYSLCFFCCLFITVTWWYGWCIEWASGNQEEVQACLVTLWLFIISCYSLYNTTLCLLCSWFENNPHFHKYSMDFHV